MGAPIGPEHEKELRRLLDGGEFNEAVEYYSRLTGSSAQDAVAYLNSLLSAASRTITSDFTLSEDQVRRIRDMLRSGNKIDAIKELREATGVGLKEGKDIVEAMADGGTFTTTSTWTLTPEQTFEIQALLNAGQTIEAVKRLRAITGLGLKESKDIVDQISGGRSSRETTVTGTSKGCGFLVLVLAGACGAAAFGMRFCYF